MNQQTIQRLSEKIQNLNAIEEDESPANAFEIKQKEVMEKLRIFKNKNEKNLVIIQQDLDRAQEYMRGFERNSSKNNDLEGQLFENLDRWMQQQLTENLERAKAIRKGLIENIDKKYKTLKVDAIETIQIEFQQAFKHNLNVIETKIDEVTEILERERSEKEETATQLVQMFGQEILKMENLISEEKQERKSQHLELLDLIEEIEDKFEASFNNEIKDREKVDSYIEGKLEEVCYSIQAKILGK